VSGAFIIDGEAAKAIEPSNGAFHDPALGHRHEPARGTGRPTGYVMLPAQGLHLLRKLPAIGSLSVSTVRSWLAPPKKALPRPFDAPLHYQSSGQVLLPASRSVPGGGVAGPPGQVVA